jgi:hypothetical protein
MALTVSGQAGEVRWGWHRAATVGAWRIHPHETGLPVLDATVQDVNAFAVTQQPLRFVARHPGGVWIWPMVTHEFAGTTLTARLGPRERDTT